MRFSLFSRACAVVACALAASLFPAAVQAQPVKIYRVVTAQTDLGPLVIAHRAFDKGERETERFSHEVWLAHAIWGQGYVRKAYDIDCATLSLKASSHKFLYWSGNRDGDLEGAPRETLDVLFATPQAGERVVAESVCRNRGDLATENGALEKLRQGTGGDAVHVRRDAPSWKHPRLAGLRAAFPVEPTNYDSRKMGGTTGHIVIERTATRNELTFAAGLIGITPRPWSSATDAIRYYSRQIPAAGLRRRIMTSDSLMVDAPLTDSKGLYRVVRIQTCERRGIPDWTVEISAEYRTPAERIEAWRFVNNAGAWCL